MHQLTLVMRQYIENIYRYRYIEMYAIGRLNIDFFRLSSPPFLLLRVDFMCLESNAGDKEFSCDRNQIDYSTQYRYMYLDDLICMIRYKRYAVLAVVILTLK